MSFFTRISRRRPPRTSKKAWILSKTVFFHESAPNRSSRPVNTQLLLESSIRIQWKTSKKKTEMHKNHTKSYKKSYNKSLQWKSLWMAMRWRPGRLAVLMRWSEWGICLYGIWYSWVRGGWGSDALGKFFRRRRRRRPPGFGKRTVLEIYYEIAASGVRGSIRLVERLPKAIFTSKKTI